MTFGTIQDPVLLLAFMLYAVTGGDLVLFTTAILGSGGVAAIMTTFVGLKKLRDEAKERQREEARTFRTVAAEEAESAMRVMGEAVDRVAADLAKERAARIESDRKLAECQEQCDKCLEAVRKLKRQEGQK